MKLTALSESPIQHVIIYGPPKTGKTTLIMQLIKRFNILYFGLEKGHAVFYKLPREDQEKIEIVNIPDTRSYPVAIETLLKVIKGGKHEICDTHGKVSCPLCKANALKPELKDSVTFTTVELNALDSNTIVVVDSITQLTASGIAHITKNQPDDYKLEFDDYAKLGKLMDIFFSHAQQAPFHLICISHESEAEQEDGKTKIVPVAGTRNYSRNVAKFFDHVIYAQVSNMKHQFNSMTTKTVNTVVGSRTDIDMNKEGASLLDIFIGKAGAAPMNNGQKAAGQLASLVATKK